MSFDARKRQRRGDPANDASLRAVAAAVDARPDAYVCGISAGAIRLVVLPALGDQTGGVVLGEWTTPPRALFALAALGARPEDLPGDAWLHAEAPRLRVEARTLAEAEALRGLGNACGFRRSALVDARPDGSAVVEWACAERIETPVQDADALEWLWPRAVAVWQRGWDKMLRLEEALTTRASKRAAT